MPFSLEPAGMLQELGPELDSLSVHRMILVPFRAFNRSRQVLSQRAVQIHGQRAFGVDVSG